MRVPQRRVDVMASATSAGHSVSVDELTAVVSSALRQHDPLDPWLTESEWDQNYWDAEAAAIALRLTDAMDVVAIRAIVVDVLCELLGSSADGEAGLQEQSRRVDLIARAILEAIA